jgi:pre-rRNA-processing protein TSR2
VQNNWGGPSSSDKRDWFAGAVVELFESRPETDLEDVETVLLQVMLDEFEVNVDDESAFEVAEQIMRLRRDVGRGDFAEVELMRARWEKKGGKEVKFQVQEGENNEDTDWDSDDFEESDENEDVEMGDSPPERGKDLSAPEVDEEGFTKVASKKRR